MILAQWRSFSVLAVLSSLVTSRQNKHSNRGAKSQWKITRLILFAVPDWEAEGEISRSAHANSVDPSCAFRADAHLNSFCSAGQRASSSAAMEKPGWGSNNGNNTLLVGKPFQIIISQELLTEHHWNKLYYVLLRAVNT